MNKLTGVMLMLTLIFAASSLTAQTKKELTRDQIADKHKWDLTDLYKDNQTWNAKKEDVKKSIEKFKEYKGSLAESADNLYNCLNYYSNVQKEFTRLSSYASRLSDLDKRKSGPLAMDQEIAQIGTKLSAASSFIEPEILTIDEQTIADFIKEKPELKVYTQYIDNIQRLKKHTLSPKEEKIIAYAEIMRDSPDDIYSIFSNADLPRPVISLSDGQKVRLDASGYCLYRASANRDDRKNVFEAFFSGLKNFERTFGAQLYAQLKKDIFYKNARGYKSCLENTLNRNNIPISVYEELINSAHKHLLTLHRYLKLRKRMLGLDNLRYYDMYPSLVKKADMDYSVKEAQKVIQESLEPLGKEYVKTIETAFENRWIDMYPTTGKRSGAYSSGSAYDVHPYILMNYNGKYDDVSTLVHELGHTMHSYLSNKNQDYVNSHYPIFLAEVAAITNEMLLMDYELKRIKDTDKRLSLLGNHLETFRTTLFRQTQFAEFELKIHELAENGEALTGEKLSNIYLDILKTYYGHDKGVTEIDDLYRIEWAYIPHFYYNFYVYSYSTSVCAASAVAEKIQAEGSKMRDKYLTDFLSAGCSEYAVPILKRIGVDMTTSEPFELAIKKMDKVMDEIEKILDKKK